MNAQMLYLHCLKTKDIFAETEFSLQSHFSAPMLSTYHSSYHVGSVAYHVGSVALCNTGRGRSSSLAGILPGLIPMLHS